MITITGLTHKQKVLMDVMWSMDDISTVTAFVKTLPKRDRQDCLSLIAIATQESIEQEDGLDAYKHDALAAISYARSR
jgi:predicted TIM-barrel fold metal-dependent hydrolase